MLAGSGGGDGLLDDRARRGDARLRALLIELRALGADALSALPAHGLGIGGSGVYGLRLALGLAGGDVRVGRHASRIGQNAVERSRSAADWTDR